MLPDRSSDLREGTAGEVLTGLFFSDDVLLLAAACDAGSVNV